MSAPNYPLRLDPLRRAGWKRAAELEGRTLAGWIKTTCDKAAGDEATKPGRGKVQTCSCPYNCPYCGRRRSRDVVGHYCKTANCQYQHGYTGCELERRKGE